MKQVEVCTSKNYTVTIGSGILGTIGAQIRQLTRAQKVCIVSDSNVWPLYGQCVQNSLRQTGLDAVAFVFSAGENNKNSGTYVNLINFLAESKFTRTDCIVALGGGVTGDLAGFAAATYLRGVPYIQVPTTLLAMVDSSVGGKTGIDLPAGKNLAGAFYQPTAVLCDIDTLNTLPEEVFRDGCAEIMKYGILYAPGLFTHLEDNGINFDQESVISCCVEIKRNVVAQDEFESGSRKLLNLGHTIGHAIEKCSNYSISHGEAVAIGIAVISRASKCTDASRITSLLKKFDLPSSTTLPAAALAQAALADKKRSGDTLDLIIPTAIGNCAIIPTPVENLKTIIEEGM